MKKALTYYTLLSMSVMVFSVMTGTVNIRAQSTGGPAQTQGPSSRSNPDPSAQAGTVTANTTTGSESVSDAGGQEKTVAELVKCGRMKGSGDEKSQKECTFQDLLNLVGDVIRFVIFNIMAPILLLGLIWFGARLILQQNRSEDIKKIKKGLMSMLLGLFFMLAAWLLVEAITRFFGVQFSSDPSQGVLKLVDFKEDSTR
jgi:Type IV secretion system pilin